jgi:hypothetical protein
MTKNKKYGNPFFNDIDHNYCLNNIQMEEHTKLFILPKL